MKIVRNGIDLKNDYAWFDIKNIEEETYLLCDVFFQKNENSVVVIEQGTHVTKALFEKLAKKEGLYVKKGDEHKYKIKCENLQDFIGYNRTNNKQNLLFLYLITHRVLRDYLESQNNEIDLDCVAKIVKSIISLIHHDKNYIHKTITNFVNSHDFKTHSLHVCFYSIHLAHKLKLTQNQLMQVGTAAFLHDVGLKKIDSHIIENSKELTFEELELVHEHPKYSVEILKENHIHDPFILDAVLHHHESYEGGGYPDKLTHLQISPFASILSLADIFDALTSDRPHRKAMDTFKALSVMKEDLRKGKINERYFKVFVKSI